MARFVTNGRFKKTLGALFILVTLALIFLAGAYLGQALPKLKAIVAYEIHTVDKITEGAVHEPGKRVIERVEYEPEERANLNRVENPRLLSYFQDLEELERWLENIEVRDIGADLIDEVMNQGIYSFDCDDYALKLLEKAQRDGYMMSFEVIHSSEYNALFKKGQIPDGTIHAINLAIIGNEVYYIEPKNHEIVFVAYLD